MKDDNVGKLFVYSYKLIASNKDDVDKEIYAKEARAKIPMTIRGMPANRTRPITIRSFEVSSKESK